MAESMKDAEDQLLESLLGSEPIADDGFSDRVVRRLRRRMWLRRLALPVAAAVGATIALKPLATLVPALFGFVQGLVPSDVAILSQLDLPSLPLIVAGGMLLAVIMTALQFIEE